MSQETISIKRYTPTRVKGKNSIQGFKMPIPIMMLAMNNTNANTT